MQTGRALTLAQRAWLTILSVYIGQDTAKHVWRTILMLRFTRGHLDQLAATFCGVPSNEGDSDMLWKRGLA